MHRTANVFASLADRVAVGDSRATGELRRHLEPEMVHIVRRVVCKGAGRSPMDRRILAEAQRVGLDAVIADGADGEQLIRRVAHCVSLLFIDGLRAPQAGRGIIDETVRV